VAAGLRALDRGRPVTIPGLRYRVTAIGGRFLPGWATALVSGRMLRPTDASVANTKRVHVMTRGSGDGE